MTKLSKYEKIDLVSFLTIEFFDNRNVRCYPTTRKRGKNMKKGLLQTKKTQKKIPGKIRQIKNIIKGEPAIPVEVPALDLPAAEGIMDNLLEKIEEGDKSINIIPEAIKATANWFGAIITVEKDAIEKIASMAEENQSIVTRSEMTVKEIKEEVARLQKLIEIKKIEEQDTMSATHKLTKFNDSVSEKAKSVAQFFGYKTT